MLPNRSRSNSSTPKGWKAWITCTGHNRWPWLVLQVRCIARYVVLCLPWNIHGMPLANAKRITIYSYWRFILNVLFILQECQTHLADYNPEALFGTVLMSRPTYQFAERMFGHSSASLPANQFARVFGALVCNCQSSYFVPFFGWL